TLDEDVVDTVIHQIRSDSIVAAGHECDLQLGADAIGARDEHRVAPTLAIDSEESAERTDIREDARRERRARQRLDAADGLVACVDVDAGLAIIGAHVFQKSSLPISVCIRRRVGEPAADCQNVRRTRAKKRSLSRSSSSMSNPSPMSAMVGAGSGSLSSAASVIGVLLSATVPSASATGARVGSRDGMPIATSA